MLSRDLLGVTAARGTSSSDVLRKRGSLFPPPEGAAHTVPALAGVKQARLAPSRTKTLPGVPAAVTTVPGTAGEVVGVTVSLDQRVASYRNEVGLFRVDDASGRVGTLRPGDRGYAAAALARRVVLFHRGQDAGATARLALPGGTLFGTYLIQNASSDRFLGRNQRNRPGRGGYAFFSFSAANPDHFSHMRQTAPLVHAMEDLTHGGDRDFNDVVLRFAFQVPPTGPPDHIGLEITFGLDPSTDTAPLGDDHTLYETVTLAGQTTPGAVVSLAGATITAGADGRFRVTGVRLATGANPFTATAAAGGLTATASRTITRDRTTTVEPPLPIDQLPLTFGLDPSSDTAPLGDDHTLYETVTLAGLTGPGAVVSLAGATVTAGADGRFRVAGVRLATGANPFTATAATAGLTATASRTIILDCGFFPDLAGWTARQDGGTTPGQGGVTVQGTDAVLREGNSFDVTLEHAFTVPAGAASLDFQYSALNFDTTTGGQIKDAFEVALVDAAGHPLVQPITGRRDAFFNLTEGVPAALGPDATTFGQTVTLGLGGVAAGTTARLIFRLVNNDGDTGTSVHVVCANLPPGATDATVTPEAVAAAERLLTPEATRQPTASQATDLLTAPPGAVAVSPAPGGGGGGGGGSLPSENFVTDPNDTRSFQGATVGTFAGLIYGADTLANRQNVVDSKLLVDGLFDSINTTPAALLPTPWALGTGGSGSHRGGNSVGSSTDLTGDGGYGYTGGGNVFDAADGIDNKWFQTSDTLGDTVFDLGAPSTKAAIFNTIDHGPLPQEAIESSVYLSNDRVDWTLAKLERVWLQGFQPNLGIQWDGFAYAVGTPTGMPFRYASVIWGGPGGLYADGDNEINGVLGLNDDYSPSVPPPLVTFDTPAEGSTVAAGTTIVVSGHAVSQAAVPRPITAVMVNGKPVDVLDATGHFFTRVTVSPGHNTLMALAIDVTGRTGTASTGLTGDQRPRAEVDFANASDVSASFSPLYARTSFNERSNVLYSDVAIKNVGDYPVDAPLYVGVTAVSDPNVRVMEAAGVTPQGIPYYDFTGLVTGGRLSPSGQTGTLSLTFSNPGRTPFTYQLVFFGLLNRAPEITSVPTVEAYAGKAYSYRLTATDPDADTVSFRLLSGPSGLSIEPQTGAISWAPGAGDLGTHDVSVQASDGRGGTALQRYTITATMPPPNRPPVFTSVPGVDAVADLSYSYDARAFDADGDPLTFSRVTGPDGLTIDPSSGKVTWTPRTDQIGPAGVSLSVDDGHGGSATQNFTILVRQDPRFVPPLMIDLTVDRVDTSQLVYDGQLLTVSGAVTAEVSNKGTSDLDSAFDVFFFEDRDFNKAFDPAIDAVLGKLIVPGPLKASQTVSVTTELSGGVLFAGNIVWAFVDSDRLIQETDETNNLTSSGRDCVFIPPPGQFDPIVQWKKDAFTVRPESNQVMMTPGVIDLNGDGVPDVVFSTFVGGNHTTDGNLRAISGDDGHDLWTVTDPAYRVAGQAGVAVGDIDGDGKSEIIAAGESQDTLIAFKSDGTFLWRSPPIAGRVRWGSASLADLDHDGKAEIVIGATVLNTDGTIRWQGNSVGGTGRGDNGIGPLSVVADLDLDGSPEVVGGQSAYHADGSLSWNAPIPDGFPAIGNFNSDTFPEIAVVARGNVYLLDHTGEILWGPKPIPGGGGGGAPTIADMDGDGRPEIGVAGARNYVVFNADGSVKWMSPTQDNSSNVTGSSVFDFEGDGQAEVIYGDEIYLRIYRGSDGKVLYQFPKGSATTYEYPLVVDVDGDGKAEIVAVANNYGIGNQTGIYVFSDANDTWVPTRQIWNQHSYHITNVNDDGTIPRVEANSWQVYNNYRLNTYTGVGQPYAAPDLVPSYVRVATAGGGLSVTARVGNAGAIAVPPGVFVTLYDGDPRVGGVKLGTVKTVGTLRPGAYEDVALTVASDALNDLTDVWVAADDDGTGRSYVNECDENNNLFQSLTGLPGTNRPPTITSIAVVQAAEGAAYRYEVTATDPDPGQTLTFALRTAPAGMTIDPATGVLTWSPAAGQSGRRAVQVVVDDGRRGRAAQIFTIDVAATLNRPPTFTTTGPTSAVLGQTYRYVAQASDLDNDLLAYDLVVRPDGMSVGSASGQIVWTPTADQMGPQDVILRVSDGRGGVDFQAYRVTVGAANTPPVITGLPFAPASVGNPYRFRVRAQDAEGDPVTFRLAAAPAGLVIDAATGVITWTPAAGQAGTQSARVVASDGRAETSADFTLQVLAAATNDPPAITSKPRTATRLGGAYTYQVVATDPNGDPLTYTLETAPAGMTVDPFGLVTWTPTSGQFGNNPVSIRVADGRGGSASQPYVLNVVTVESESPPAITSNPPQTAVAGKTYSYNATATDADGDTIVWVLDAGPAGLSLDPATGSVRWTPTAGQIGPQMVTLRALDGRGGYATQSYTVAVRGVNSSPSIGSTPPTRAAVGSAYVYAVGAADPDNDPLTFSLVRAQAGMTIDPATGLLLWTPAAGQTGDQAVTVRVDDGQGGAATQSFTVNVSSSAVNRPPAITSDPVYVATILVAYTYQVTATDPEGEALTFSLLANPTGMTIDPRSGLLRWTPAAGQLGPIPVTVAAVDPAGNGAAQRYTLTVLGANRPPVIVSAPATAVTAGAAYRYDVRATDPDGDRLAYRLEVAPAGMAVDALGRITWATTSAVAGVHRVALAVSDGRGGSASQSFDLAVAPDVQAPRVAISLGTTIVDPGGTVVAIVSGTDDVGVAAVTLTLDGVPVAVDVAGRATLRPQGVGPHEVVATLTDAAGNVGRATASLRVVDRSDTEFPVVDLAPVAGGRPITAPVDVRGTASDANLDFYVLELAPVAGGPFVEFARGTVSTTDGVLGRLDPSTLANDAYILRLTAVDKGGNLSRIERTVDVAGDLKLGNFTLSFTDLTIPVSGIPITFTRTYDSLNAAARKDLGYGWRLEFRDADLRTSVAPSGGESVGIYNPFRDGTRVYVTLPGGRREGFTFRPRLAGGFSGGLLGIFGPAFEPDPGVTSSLGVDSVQLGINEDGTVRPWLGSSLPYNPSSEYYGGKYYLTTQDGALYTIDGLTGAIRTVTDPNGNTLTFTDAGITSSAGPKVDFERDPQGRIAAVVDPAGNRVRYRYDARGDLVAVTDREGNVTQFKYDEPRRPHFLTEVVDPLGRSAVRNEYDDKGRLVRLTDADGKFVSMVHDPGNSIETVRDPLENATTYEYDARGNVVREVNAAGDVIRWTYDANSYVLTETAVLGDGTELTTTSTRDAFGNPLSETDPLGNVTRYTYQTIQRWTYLGARLTPFTRPRTVTDPLGNTTTNEYDGNGNLLKTTDPTGVVTTVTYDRGNPKTITAAGETTTFDYDAAGRVTKQTDAAGTPTTYTYDANGNLRTTTRRLTTPAGVRALVTTIEYDKQGRATQVTDAEGGVTRTEYDAAGNRTASVDALDRRTEFRYNARGELIETIYPDVTPLTLDDNPRTRTEYDAAGRTTATVDELGRRTALRYDRAGRLVETIYPDATPATLDDNPRTRTEYAAAGRTVATVDERNNRTEYGYDKAGQQTVVRDALLRETVTTFDAAGRRESVTDALGHITRFRYDPAGRLVETVYHDGTKTTTGYDRFGRRDAQIDQLSRATRYEYDPLGRLKAVVDAKLQRTEYGYDETGNLVTQADANRHVTRYEYDGLGRRTATVLPLGQRSYIAYDKVGNVSRGVDYNGAAIDYLFDDRNRLTAKRFRDGTSVGFTYTPTGLRETYTDARGTTRWAYDERGRLLRRTEPDGMAISYTYDSAGNRTGLTTVAGTVRYTFDELNRMKTVIDPENGATTYAYDEVGNLRRTNLPNGTSEVRGHDALNRLVSIEHSNSAGVFAGFRYILAPTGRRDAVVENTGRRVDYRYDLLDRLIEEMIDEPAAGDRTIGYAYDPVGNRQTRTDTAEGTTTYTYDDNDRLLAETWGVQTIAYAYDDNGNTLSKAGPGGRVGYAWDGENRLVGADTDGDGRRDVTIAYDAAGIQVSQTAGGQETRFLVDQVQLYAEVALEYRPGGAVVVSYVHGQNLNSQTRGGVRSYFHADGLGSIRALTGMAGIVNERYTFEAFGRTLMSAGTTVSATLFAGERRDAILGLDYLRARYLDPSTGRFTSRDPFSGNLLSPTSQNAYIYANVNPVSNTDPNGNFSIVEISIANSIRVTLGGSQANFGNAIQDQIRYGGNAGIKSLILASVAVPVFGIAAQSLIRAYQLTGRRLIAGSYTAVRNFYTKELLARAQGGYQVNHININSIFKSVIPTDEGVSVLMYGYATRNTSQHYAFHRSLDQFLDPFRRAGIVPTNGQFDRAVRSALRDANFNYVEAEALADLAREQRLAYGLFDDLDVPVRTLPPPTVYIN